MKPRTVRRLCLVDGMNLDHIEGWLEAMAARGLHYDHSDAFLFHFRRGEPAAVRYRLEPRGTLDCPEGMEHCRTLGWELTGYMGKGFSLFRTWEPDAPELHTDPVVRGYGLDKLARLVRWFATPMLICALVILALPLWLLLAWDEPVLSLVTGSGDNLFLCILSEWIAIYMSFRSFSSFFALRRRLRAGKEPRRSGWRCSARINAACLAGSFILVALSFAVLAAGRGMRWEGETATVNRPFPDFALEELEGRPRLEAAPSVWSVERRGVDLDNYVRFDWSVLAPEQCGRRLRDQFPAGLVPSLPPRPSGAFCTGSLFPAHLLCRNPGAVHRRAPGRAGHRRSSDHRGGRLRTGRPSVPGDCGVLSALLWGSRAVRPPRAAGRAGPI